MVDYLFMHGYFLICFLTHDRSYLYGSVKLSVLNYTCFMSNTLFDYLHLCLKTKLKVNFSFSFDRPSLLNNEIVRQVEAAIAPLRSSTESPERSSSPESDSMMMADRDIMTLPLRKRKLYMHEGSPIGATALNVPTREMEKTLGHIGLTSSSVEASHVTIDAVGNANHETDAKVMRMSSVIQFAKAS